jgi:di/tripeptidase
MKVAQEPAIKRTYHRPEVKDYGKINEITASGASGLNNDRAGGKNHWS